MVCFKYFVIAALSIFQLTHYTRFTDSTRPSAPFSLRNLQSLNDGQIYWNSTNDFCLQNSAVEVANCSFVTVDELFGSKPQPSLANQQCSTCCPYPKGECVSLCSFSLEYSPDITNSSKNLFVYPPFEPISTNNFYTYTLNEGENSGVLNFTATSFSAGAFFRIRIDFAADYTYLKPGESILFTIAGESSHLIEFDVIQNMCAGDDIEEYSITIYTNSSHPVQTILTNSSDVLVFQNISLYAQSTVSNNSTYLNNDSVCNTNNNNTLFLATLVQPCSNITLLPRPYFAMNFPPHSLDNGLCSCLCPFPKGGDTQIYKWTAVFIESVEQLTTTIQPIPVINEISNNTRFYWNRMKAYATGTVLFTVLEASAGAQPLLKINFEPVDQWITFEVNQTIAIPIVAGTNFIQFDLQQAKCAGDVIAEYSLTIYQQDPPRLGCPTNDNSQCGQISF